jgi:hypothetical protein
MQPDGESGDLVITVTRSGGGTRAISIPFGTHAQSAEENTDFTPTSGTVEWADGDTSDKTIVVPFVDDLNVESEETFVVELGEPPTGVDVDTSSVTATIADDDGPGDSVALTSAGRLVHFNRAEPRLRWSVELSGLAGEKIRGIDYRPADGRLYALTDASKLYTIDPMTGAASPAATLVAAPGDTSSPFSALPAEAIGIDFNPVTDELRVTSTAGHNLRVAVDAGHVTTDTALTGTSPGYTALAHHNNIAPACRTTLYAIDVETNRFLSQSTRADGINQGVGGLALDATASGGFDVYTDAMGVHTGLAVLTVGGTSGFYSIELGSGKATTVRTSVGPLAAGESIVAFAMPTLPATSTVTQQPGELFGVTATQVISFNRAATTKFCTSATINGLDAGESIVGLDMRPSSGVLYALTKNGSAGALRRLDPIGGNTSPAIPISVALQGTEFGVDFDPTGTVALRIVSDAGQNLRVTDLDVGTATSDTALDGANTITGAAYTDAVPGAGTAALYVIDAATDRLRLQTAPNSGTLVDVGPLGMDITDVAGFDIDGRDNTGFVIATVGGSSQLHTLDLATGALSPSLGTIAGAALRGATRATPQTNVYGVTTENKLVQITLADPSMVRVISDPMLMPAVDTITNLDSGEHLVSIDVRPVSNVIYGLGSLGNVYTVNSGIARANKQGPLSADPMDTSSPFMSLAGAGFGIDFDPTAISLRIVSDAEQNLRVPDITMPRAITDSALAFGGAIDVTAAAYTNSYPPRPGQAITTTLYVIDVGGGRLMVQTPQTGALTPVGPLAASGSFAIPGVPSLDGFDIGSGNNGVVLAAFQRPAAGGAPEPFSRLYRIDLQTGAATEIGQIGGAPLRGLAIQIR